MKLIWTKSNKILSVAIRWALREPVSHFGIVFDNGIIFHSNLAGTHVQWYRSFQKSCDIVYEHQYDLKLKEEELVFQNILNRYDDLGYDFKAFFYFCWRGLLYRILGKPLPTKNEWNSSDRFLCTELASTLPDDVVPRAIKDQDLSIVSPYRLYLELKE